MSVDTVCLWARLLCDDWAQLRSPTNSTSEILLIFEFDGPGSTPWQGVFVSFAFQK